MEETVRGGRTSNGKGDGEARGRVEVDGAHAKTCCEPPPYATPDCNQLDSDILRPHLFLHSSLPPFAKLHQLPIQPSSLLNMPVFSRILC